MYTDRSDTTHRKKKKRRIKKEKKERKKKSSIDTRNPSVFSVAEKSTYTSLLRSAEPVWMPLDCWLFDSIFKTNKYHRVLTQKSALLIWVIVVTYHLSTIIEHGDSSSTGTGTMPTAPWKTSFYSNLAKKKGVGPWYFLWSTPTTHNTYKCTPHQSRQAPL